MELLDYFLPQITEGIKVLKTLNKKDKIYSPVKMGIRRTIQYYTEQLDWIYSEKVVELCNGIGVDVKTLPKYNIIKVVGGERNRPNIIGEHTTPLNELIELLIESPIEEVKNILMNYSPICWITREENDELNKLGYNKSRPGGWRKCYSDARINISQ